MCLTWIWTETLEIWISVFINLSDVDDFFFYWVQHNIKGVQKKTSLLIFCFADISASVNWIFKILVPTPHNIALIMGGRHKNFTNPINISWDISKTKNQKGAFFCTPFKTSICHHIVLIVQIVQMEICWQQKFKSLVHQWPFKISHLNNQ